jgi:muramoyltetrapeptide carboxypeptidase
MNGLPNQYAIEAHDLNTVGKVEGIVTGGNLAIIYSLLGTDSDADYSGKILFIEEIGEAVYAIDRMFHALRKAGKLNQISGLIVGGMTNVKDSEIPYGCSVEEVIRKHVSDSGIPLCFNFPAGHISDNRAVIIGKKATLNVGESSVVFSQ